MATSLTNLSGFNPILEHVQTACLLVEKNGIVINANRRAESATGFSNDDLIGKSLSDAHWIASREIAAIQEYLEGDDHNSAFSIEFELRHKDGSENPSVLQIEKLRFEDNVIGLMLLLPSADTNARSQQKKGNPQEHKIERRLRSLMEKTSDFVLQFDDEGRILYSNPAIQTALGYSKQDLEKRSVFELVPPADEEKLKILLAGVNDAPEVDCKVIHLLHQDGQAVLCNGSISRDPSDGTNDHITGLLRLLTNSNLSDFASDNQNLDSNPAGCTTSPTCGVKHQQLRPPSLNETESHLHLTHRTAKMGSFDILSGCEEIEFCADGCMQVLGLSTAAQVKTWKDFLSIINSHDRRVMARAAFEECRNEGTAFDFECQIDGPDGESRWIRLIGIPTEGGEDSIYGIRGTIQDISNRKLAEQAVRASEQMFSAIFEHEPECVKLIDRDGILLKMNPAGLVLVEAESIDQVFGTCVYSIIAPEYRTFFKLENEAVFEGASRTLEFDIIGLNGTRRRMESHQAPLRDENGNITANLAVTRDITQRRIAENRLRESEAFWRSLTESSTDHVVTLDRDLRIVYSNQGLDGIPACELTGHPMYILVEPSQRAEVIATLNHVLKTGQPANFETVINSSEHEKIYHDSRVSARIVEGRVIGLTVNTRDISKSKRAENALRNVVSGTASDTGAAFYHSITRKLSEAINVEHVLVAETIGTNQDQLRSLSFWCDGKYEDEFAFDLAGSPCEVLASNPELFVPSKVKENFPDCEFLQPLSVQGFVGLKLLDSSGKQIGVLAALSARTLTNKEEIISLIQIFAERIAGEIERARTHLKLQKSNQELDLAHERLNLAINGTSDGLWDWDLSTKCIWISPNGMAMLGEERVHRAEGIEHWETFLHSSDVHQMKKAVDEHFRLGKKFDVEVRVRTVSEEYVWIHFRGEAIRDSSGTPIRMSGSMQDVTQQRRGERALKESENRMRILLGQVPAILWSTDHKLDLTMMAGAALQKADLYHRQDSWENVQEFFEVYHPTEVPLQKHAQALDGLAGNFRSEQRGRTYQNYVEPLKNDFNQIIGVIGVALDITEQRLTEDSLEQSERMYRTLFENLPVGVAITDEAGSLLDINESCVELAGAADKSELIGRPPLKDFADTADQDRVKDRIANEGSARREELKLRKLNGESYYALVSVAPLQFNQRKCLLSVFEDITSRKELEKKLQRFKYMLDRSGEAIFLLDPESAKFIDVNPTCYEQLGYTRDELIGMSMFQIQSLGDHTTSEQWANLVSLLRVENSQSISCSHQRKNGTTFPVEITVSLSRHEGHEFMLAIARDVTKRKMVERSLSESEARARSMLENHVDGVAVVSNDTIVYVNAPLCSLMGRTRQAVEGQSVKTLLPDRNRTQQEDHTFGYWTNQMMESELEHHDGSSVPVEIVKRQFEFEGQESILYVFRDIAQRKELERDARIHREMVAHVTRISTLGEMATGLAHELNQPLSAICLFAEACTAEFASSNPDDSKINQILKDLSEQSMRAGAIVDRIRKFVGKEEFKQTNCLLSSIVDDVLDLLRMSLDEKEIEVNVEVHSAAECVYVDPVQIEQVLVNLLQNSIDAIDQSLKPDGGQIAITARKISPNYLEVTVRDNGLGISESQAEEVFNAFYTTKYSGMGMGLAICRTIIEGHQGQISVKSDLNHGTICRFTLPTQSATRQFQST